MVMKQLKRFVHRIVEQQFFTWVINKNNVYFSEWLAKSLREAKPSSNEVDDAPDFNVGKYSFI